MLHFSFIHSLYLFIICKICNKIERKLLQDLRQCMFILISILYLIFFISEHFYVDEIHVLISLMCEHMIHESYIFFLNFHSCNENLVDIICLRWENNNNNEFSLYSIAYKNSLKENFFTFQWLFMHCSRTKRLIFAVIVAAIFSSLVDVSWFIRSCRRFGYH